MCDCLHARVSDDATRTRVNGELTRTHTHTHTHTARGDRHSSPERLLALVLLPILIAAGPTLRDRYVDYMGAGWGWGRVFPHTCHIHAPPEHCEGIKIKKTKLIVLAWLGRQIVTELYTEGINDSSLSLSLTLTLSFSLSLRFQMLPASRELLHICSN